MMEGTRTRGSPELASDTVNSHTDASRLLNFYKLNTRNTHLGPQNRRNLDQTSPDVNQAEHKKNIRSAQLVLKASSSESRAMKASDWSTMFPLMRPTAGACTFPPRSERLMSSERPLFLPGFAVGEQFTYKRRTHTPSPILVRTLMHP